MVSITLGPSLRRSTLQVCFAAAVSLAVVATPVGAQVNIESLRSTEVPQGLSGTLGSQAFCVIQPREQLIVIRRLPEGPERALVARPMTPVRRGAPFCPPKAEVLLRPHQANLKIDIWAAIEDTVVNAVSRGP